MMSWPTPQDYNEAVQNPEINFADADLRAGRPWTDKNGLPRPISGAFASVYQFDCGESQYAVRCFLQRIEDQQRRYAELSQFIDNDSLEFTVPFTFLPQGIRVHDEWFPLLKMQWVSGETLHRYIANNLNSGDRLSELAARFKSMCLEMERAGIAHGDLQHGNIVVMADGNLRLVDYDGMYVPGLHGWQSNELGHRNYQHPKRTKSHFGAYLDNFSAWVIYLSLRALAIQPGFWHSLRGGDECLLLRQSDFEAPLSSVSFAMLEHRCGDEISRLCRVLRYCLSLNVEQVPPLDGLADAPDALPPMPSAASVLSSRRWSQNYSGEVPDGSWIQSWVGGQHDASTATLEQRAVNALPQMVESADPPATLVVGQGAAAAQALAQTLPAPVSQPTAQVSPTVSPASLTPSSANPSLWAQLSPLARARLFFAGCILALSFSTFLPTRHLSEPLVPAPGASYQEPVPDEDELAAAAYSEGRFADAVDHYTRHLQLQPNDYVTYYRRAAAERRLKQYDAAIADASKFIEINNLPRASMTNNGLWMGTFEANARFERGASIVAKALDSSKALDTSQLKSALDDLKAAVKHTPVGTRDLFYQGAANELLGDTKQAIEDYTKCIQMAGNNRMVEDKASWPTLEDVGARLSHLLASRAGSG